MLPSYRAPHARTTNFLETSSFNPNNTYYALLSNNNSNTNQSDAKQKNSPGGRTSRLALSSRSNDRDMRSVPLKNTMPIASNVNQPVRADLISACQFTKANPHLVADSRGYLCSHITQHPAGCCPPQSKHTQRYTCDTCDPNRCCEGYEQCVSCCLTPNEASTRIAIESHHSMRRYAIHSAFDICSAACRSGSSSVVHENAYKHNRHHCFGLSAPEVDPSLHSGVFDFATPVNQHQ